MKTVFVSFENYQELHELTVLVKELKTIHSDWMFVLFDTTSIYSLNRKPFEVYEDTYDQVIKGVNTSEVSFKSLSIVKKLYVTSLNTIKILKNFKKYDVDLMLTGVPLIFFRVASYLKQKIFYISYMRALIVNHSIEHSLSNKLDRKIKKIPFLKKISIFDSWYCDLLVTVSDINCEYFYTRGMSPEKIKISGSLFLDKISNKKNLLSGGEKLEIIFLTYAAAYHGNEKAHIDQITVIKKLISYQETYGYDLTIRVHPRDNEEEYYSIADKHKSVRIDTSSMEKFLMQCSKNKVIVSAFSTLNFEWEYLNGISCFYSTSKLYSTYGNFYKTLNLSPYFDIKKMVKDVVNNKIHYSEKKIYKKHSKGNINYFIKLIEKVIVK